MSETHDEVAEFVEEFGIGLEASGLPRAAGRILAWLMVCDPPEQSAEDLATGAAHQHRWGEHERPFTHP